MNVKVIKSKELDELRSAGKLDENLSNKYNLSIYQLDGSPMLVDFDNEGHIYPSMKELIDTYDEIFGDQSDRVYHILEERFPYNHNFIDQSDEVANQTLKNLGIDVFDYQLESLRHLDNVLNNVLNESYSLDNIYPGLIAIVGKVIINHVGQGKWQLYKSEDFEVWEPSIIDDKNNSYNPYLLVYKELYEYYLENDEPVALYDHVQIELLQHNIRVEKSK